MSTIHWQDIETATEDDIGRVLLRADNDLAIEDSVEACIATANAIGIDTLDEYGDARAITEDDIGTDDGGFAGDLRVYEIV